MTRISHTRSPAAYKSGSLSTSRTRAGIVFFVSGRVYSPNGLIAPAQIVHIMLSEVPRMKLWRFVLEVRTLVPAAVLALSLISASRQLAFAQSESRGSNGPISPERALLDQYCVVCHN